MSTITVSGILKTPTGSVLGNTLLRVRSVTSHTGSTIRYAHKDITIPANGQYNFTLLYGEYSIYVQYSGSFRLSGVISINATDVAAHPAAQYSIETLLDTFALENSSILEDVFTINGSNGTDGSNGIDGTNGTNGDTIYTQFYWSADGVDFHPTLAATDYYFRTRVVTNAVAGAWSVVTKFRPQAGVDYNTNGIDANAYATQAAQAANTAVQASDTAVNANYSIELNVTAAHNSEVIATEAATLAAQQATAATDAAAIATTKAAEAAASADYCVKWGAAKLVQYKLALGTTPKRGHHGLEFTIADADVVVGSIIVAWYQPIEDLDAKEHEDESEFDNLDISVLPSSIVAGSFKISVQTRNNAPISGQKTLLYSVRN